MLLPSVFSRKKYNAATGSCLGGKTEGGWLRCAIPGLVHLAFMNERNRETAEYFPVDLFRFCLSDERIRFQIVPHSDFTQLNPAQRKALTIQHLTYVQF